MTDNQPDDIPGDAPGSIAAQPASVGAVLREARTRLGLGVADVANRLKFAPRQIEALEADDFARLPEITFVRGFVRSYARLLQLDPAPLLDALPGAVVQAAPAIANTLAEVPFPDVYSARKPNILWLAAALAVAAALALFAWLHGNAPGAPKAPKAPKASHVETPAPAAALPAPAVPDTEVAKTPQTAAVTVQQPAVPPAKPVAAVTSQQDVVPPAKPVVASSAARHAAAIRLAFDEESWVE
ncbi:MAG: helix-turn-helix domain-containing protein, partial [Betaproteobacteria bacterium]|nr:helix-turn-helix domain-containing protein [Betaproteobacteria bacterium]